MLSFAMDEDDDDEDSDDDEKQADEPVAPKKRPRFGT